MTEEPSAQGHATQRARMVAEVEAMYAETRSLTGLAAMSPQVRAALGRVERHRLVPTGQQPLAYRKFNWPGHRSRPGFRIQAVTPARCFSDHLGDYSREADDIIAPNPP